MKLKRIRTRGEKPLRNLTMFIAAIATVALITTSCGGSRKARGKSQRQRRAAIARTGHSAQACERQHRQQHQQTGPPLSAEQYGGARGGAKAEARRQRAVPLHSEARRCSRSGSQGCPRRAAARAPARLVRAARRSPTPSHERRSRPRRPKKK